MEKVEIFAKVKKFVTQEVDSHCRSMQQSIRELTTGNVSHHKAQMKGSVECFKEKFDEIEPYLQRYVEILLDEYREDAGYKK